MVHRIAIIPGDGVGPEVVSQARKVLDVICDRDPALELA
jgi:isocitrate/isopropylmalate dehydrogenase